MTLARWPKQGFVKITGLVGGEPVDVRGTKGDHIGKFNYDGDRPSRWLDEGDPWVHGYWFWDWSDQRQRVESNDAGAVYSGRDWTWRGTVIRFNKFWEITGFKDRGCVGVYLDDMLFGTHVHGNLFWQVTRATVIGGGRDCVFENNVYAQAMNWAAYHVATTMKQRLDEMPIQDPVWARKYPELLRIWEDEPAAPKGNIIRHNVSQGGDFDGVRADAARYVELTGNLVADDVEFSGRPPHSFALRRDSPAWALGFEAIPEDRIGPRH